MRRLLLWAARNDWLRRRVPRLPFTRRAVRRFMPGEHLEDALAAAARLQAEGVGTVFTTLGENVTDLEAAARDVDGYHEVLERVHERRFDTEVSVKLTHFGLDIDGEAAAVALAGLAAHGEQLGTWVWIDMEGSAYTEATVALYERLRPSHQRLGLCLQAYLHRTSSDVERLLPVRPAIRLVKGAYDEPAAIALRTRREVEAAFLAIGE